MKSRTKHNTKLTESLLVVLKTHQEASLLAFRYRTLLASLRVSYPSLTSTTQKEVLLEFIRDTVYLDRKLRKLTEGKDKLNKEIHSQQYQLTELGSEVGLQGNITNIKKEINER